MASHQNRLMLSFIHCHLPSVSLIVGFPLSKVKASCFLLSKVKENCWRTLLVHTYISFEFYKNSDGVECGLSSDDEDADGHRLPSNCPAARTMK